MGRRGLSAIILPFSGGLDSVVLFRLLREPPCVYVRWESRYEGAELETIRNLQALAHATDLPVPDVTVLQGPQLGQWEQHPEGHVPQRNLVLLTYIAAWAQATLGVRRVEIPLGAVAGESSPDKSWRFIHHATRALSAASDGGKQVEVTAPLKIRTKAQNVARYLRQHPSEAERRFLLASRSCHRLASLERGTVGCGACRACFRRWVALRLNGITERTMTDPARELFTSDLRANLKRGLRRVPLADWPGVLVNNLDAWRAVRGAG